MEIYITGMGGIDLVNQRAVAYHLNRKLTIAFYLRTFFDLMGVACGKSYFVYKMMHPDNLKLFNSITTVST